MSASSCNWCQSSNVPLWLCLYRGCLKIGCGEDAANHANIHNSHLSSHCIFINLSSLKVWCYMCEMEVTKWVLCKLDMSPSLQAHYGGQISPLGIAVARPVTPNDSSSGDDEENRYLQEEDQKPKGLVGLRNLGLTCYMNAAIQALSNSVPLCQFFKDCPSFLNCERKQQGIVRPFHKLLFEMWHQKRPAFVAPSLLYHSFRNLYPMFRLYTQQDSQEFLRYFMDQLHEELRKPCFPLADNDWDDEDKDDDDDNEFSSMENLSDRNEEMEEISHSDNEDYETCDSGLSEKTCDSENSNSSSNTIHHKAKRKKKHHKFSFDNKWIHYGVGSADHDPSEFSDAMSDTLLLESKANKRHIENPSSNSSTLKPGYSTTTSGLGSSKPSMSSISSCMGKPPGLHHINKPRLSNASKLSTKSIQRKKKQVRYRSIISDSFDGVLVSSVQCLTCNTTSSRKETFQDLSLPIPSSDQLNLLHQHTPQQQKPHGTISTTQNSSFNIYLSKNTCDVTSEGWMWLWIWSIWGWVRSWLWGPSVSLFNCLAAFFSADELKGDNMYSCEKCGKLRNGVKYSKVIELPEILIIHLKRFRHEYMYSSKISQYVAFPVQGLDLSPFLHKDCTSEVRSYDLYAVICHHGAVGSGHYTAYAQNASNNRWYEFDDQCVTEVNLETVANCEAYVLFYKKVSPEMTSRRQRTVELLQVSSHEPSLMQFFVSKQWINKFNTFSEPGPIDNSDFLCPHGGVQPSKASYVGDLVMVFNQGVWEYLHQVFGGGPACTSLYECITCREEQEALLHRQKLEHETFIQLHGLFREEEHPSIVYAISMRWFRTWETFVLGKQQLSEPPGPIDNTVICINRQGQLLLKPGSDYAPISKEMWNFFHDIYGGGPELFVRYGVPQSPVPQHHGRQDETYEPQVHVTEERESNERKKTEMLMSLRSKSLSSDDLPFSVSLSQRSQREFSRQRTLSASEVNPTFPDYSGSTSSEDDVPNESSKKNVIKWEEVDDKDDLPIEREVAYITRDRTTTTSHLYAGQEAHQVISRPHTRSYARSFNY
ncbi:Ubiquitin carboxyl-terminal hydrolase 20 [Armadillidium vulgare]|nr:Ubiquitin carboxyl-terminal hydrolase 20 [Armadillidium vulgare]